MHGRVLRRVLAGAAVVLLVGAGVRLAWAIGDLLTPEGDEVISLDGLGEGTPAAIHLADGTPAFVLAHADGSVDVISAFDAHRPSGLGQLLWWCASSSSFEGPHTGSKYDEYGVKYDGPAPHGLVTWPVTVDGGQGILGEARAAPPIGTPYTGPPAVDRLHCSGESAIVVHTFDGWDVWDSPQDLVAASHPGWALLSGQLMPGAEQPVMCALSGCTDAVRVRGAEMPRPDVQLFLHPWPERQWLVRVEDGQLTDITRTIRPADWLPRR